MLRRFAIMPDTLPADISLAICRHAITASRQIFAADAAIFSPIAYYATMLISPLLAVLPMLLLLKHSYLCY